MVAHLPLNLRIAPMTLEDIPAVHEIERASFPVPWPSYAFRQELETNRMAHYLVARAEIEHRGVRRHLADGGRGARDLVRGRSRTTGARASAVA